jgi:hypothetical protein
MWREEMDVHAFSALVLDTGEILASRSGRFLSDEKAPGTLRTWGCVGATAGVDKVMNSRTNQPKG